MRLAPPSERPPLLDALEQTGATDPQVASTRDICLEAYRALAEGDALASAPLASAAPSARAHVARAEAAIERAERGLQACSRQVVELDRQTE